MLCMSWKKLKCLLFSVIVILCGFITMSDPFHVAYYLFSMNTYSPLKALDGTELLFCLISLWLHNLIWISSASVFFFNFRKRITSNNKLTFSFELQGCSLLSYLHWTGSSQLLESFEPFMAVTFTTIFICTADDSSQWLALQWLWLYMTFKETQLQNMIKFLLLNTVERQWTWVYISFHLSSPSCSK